jgi:hypothetical protein
MAGKPEQQSQSRAEKQARDDRKVERGVFAAMDDIAGEPAEAEREFSAEVQQRANDDEESPENEDCAAEFANRVHNRILLQAADKSFRISSVTS